MYQYYNVNPCGKSVGDCTVRAIAKATGQTWQAVYWSLCYKGFELCDMPSSNTVWGAYLHEIGFRRHIIPNSYPDFYSVEDFSREHKDGTYIVCTSGHVVCISDGIIYDAWNSSKESVLFYWRR